MMGDFTEFESRSTMTNTVDFNSYHPTPSPLGSMHAQDEFKGKYFVYNYLTMCNNLFHPF